MLALISVNRLQSKKNWEWLRIYEECHLRVHYFIFANRLLIHARKGHDLPATAFCLAILNHLGIFGSKMNKQKMMAHCGCGLKKGKLENKKRTLSISGSFHGPLSDLRHPPASAHVQVPPRKSGNSLWERTCRQMPTTDNKNVSNPDLNPDLCKRDCLSKTLFADLDANSQDSSHYQKS